MRSRIIRLDHSLLAYLPNQYQITIVLQGKPHFQIKSEETIVSWSAIHSFKKQFMQKNKVVVHSYLMVVDRRLTWTLIKIKNSLEPPERIYTGTILSEEADLTQITGIAEIGNKVVFIFSGFKLVYVTFPEQDQPNLQIFCKQFIPYGHPPQYQHSRYAVMSYLPNQEQHHPILSKFHRLSQERGVLIMGYKSVANGLCSLYCVQYCFKRGYLVSGKCVLDNIHQDIIAIHSFVEDYFLIQTAGSVILWKIGNEQNHTQLNLQFKSQLTAVEKGKQPGYVGISPDEKIILLTLSRDRLKVEEEQLKISFPNLTLTQIFAHPTNQQYYILTIQCDLYYYHKDKPIRIVSNQATSIVGSDLRMDSNYNYIIVEKERGLHKQTIIFGNHLFVYDAHHYQHGLLLSNSRLLHHDINATTIAFHLTSPLIGTLKLNFSLSPKPSQSTNKTQYVFELTLDTSPKQEQSLFYSSKFQINSDQISQFGKSKTPISKLFEDSADYVTSATVLANDLIVFSLSDQIHVFDTKLARKYIYCCNGEIKRIFSLNDFNLLGVELFDYTSSNQLLVLVLEADKATKMKSIAIPERFTYIQLSTLINTAEYKINIFGTRMVICSNDGLHRFQVQKLQAQDFEVPLPKTNLHRYQLVPLVWFGGGKSSDFMIIFREEVVNFDKQSDEVEVYIGSFSPKYLFKKLLISDITINYERILTLSSLPRDTPLLATIHQYEEAKNTFRNLAIIGQKCISMLSIKLGKLEVQWLESDRYLRGEIRKVQCLGREVVQSCNSMPIAKPLRMRSTSKKQYYLIFNSRELYYTFCANANAEQVSYYSLINDEFNEFRNNIAVVELEDEQFMKVFNSKMVIKDVKYLSDSAIFVLYESAIIVLQVGFNDSLVVRQELKFKAQGEGEVIKIEEFLQNYDEDSIYLRDLHGRIYLLQLVEGTYRIVLHSNMDEDVLLFSRVQNWQKRERTYYLKGEAERNREQLILKKDGQLQVKGGESKQSNKFIYL